jgi:hypothetical protein
METCIQHPLSVAAVTFYKPTPADARVCPVQHGSLLEASSLDITVPCWMPSTWRRQDHIDACIPEEDPRQPLS